MANLKRMSYLILSILCIMTVGLYIGGIFSNIETVQHNLIFNISFSVIPLLIFIIGMNLLHSSINDKEELK